MEKLNEWKIEKIEKWTVVENEIESCRSQKYVGNFNSCQGSRGRS